MNVSDKPNRGIRIIPVAAAAFIAFVCISCATPYYQSPGSGQNVMPPSWAPYYDNVNMARYYYLPDIECYYDVWNREFVYLEDGNWMFSSTLPPDFSWYNLNNAFVVVLNQNVYEPWRHFHYYVAHYPRYYYETTYRNNYYDRDRPMRGFNENPRARIYNNGPMTREDNRTDMHRNEPGNGRYNPNDNRPYQQPGNQRNNPNDNRPSQQQGDQRNNPNDNRPGQQQGNQQNNRNAGPGNIYSPRPVEATHPAQRMDYYGKNIGRPVKVQKNMTEKAKQERSR